MAYEGALLIAAAFFTLLYFFKLALKPKQSFPPGPSVGFPFLGILPSYLGSQPHEIFDRWSKEFGEIFSIKILGTNYIVLNSIDVIREAYVLDGNGNNFLDRPTEYGIIGAPFGFRAFAVINGPEWALQRKIFGSVLQKTSGRLEASISDSAKAIVSKVEELRSEPIDIYQILAQATLNVVSSLVFSQRLCETDPEAATLIRKDTRKYMAELIPDDGFLYGITKKIHAHFFSRKNQILMEVKESQFKLMKRFVEQKESEYDPQNIKDYVDKCLKQKQKERTEAGRNWFNMETLTSNMFAFFIAAVDTTTTTLYSAVYLLVKHPAVQERCFDELNSVIEAGKVVTPSDRNRLPYFSAVIYEIYRYAMPGAIPQARRSIKETRLRGYDIPAGTITITNLWSASRDPKYWENPNKFDPNHFYEKNRSRELTLINFSFGKRGCPGESLATAEIFIFLALLIQNFKISEDPEAPILDSFISGFSRGVPPFKVRFSKRT